MLQQSGATTFIGSVGTDSNASKMAKIAADQGLNVRYHVTEGHPTGTCAAAVMDGERTLVASLGAAEHYSMDHLNLPETQELVARAKVIYVEGFFMPVSREAIMALSSHATRVGQVFGMNLSAPFLIETPEYLEVRGEGGFRVTAMHGCCWAWGSEAMVGCRILGYGPNGPKAQ